MATINLGAIRYNWKGAWSSSTAYVINDVVSNGGNSYVSIQAGTNQAVGNATAYWNIMSSAGTNGTDLSSLLSTRGDLVFKNASALARLAKGTEGQVLGQGANDPAWVNGSAKTLTTQGDLLYRDGSGLQRLAKGTAGKALVMNSGANAPEWGEAGGGKINQIVQDIEQGAITISSTSYADVLSLAITPSATSSKILLAWTAIGGVDSDNYGAVSLHKNGTIMSGAIGTSGSGPQNNVTGGWVNTGSGTGVYLMHPMSGMFIDTPSSTSAITYAMKAKRTYGSANVYLNRQGNASNATFVMRTMSHLTAWEILA